MNGGCELLWTVWVVIEEKIDSWAFQPPTYLLSEVQNNLTAEQHHLHPPSPHPSVDRAISQTSPIAPNHHIPNHPTTSRAGHGVHSLLNAMLQPQPAGQPTGRHQPRTMQWTSFSKKTCFSKTRKPNFDILMVDRYFIISHAGGMVW